MGVGRQMQVAVDLLIAEGNGQDLEWHRHQTARFPIGLVALQLRLLGQLIAFEVGITGDRVVACRPQIGLASTTQVTLLLQRFALLEILASHLAELIDPVARRVALQGIELLLSTAHARAGCNMGEDIFKLYRIGPLPNPVTAANDPIPGI